MGGVKMPKTTFHLPTGFQFLCPPESFLYVVGEMPGVKLHKIICVTIWIHIFWDMRSQQNIGCQNLVQNMWKLLCQDCPNRLGPLKMTLSPYNFFSWKQTLPRTPLSFGRTFPSVTSPVKDDVREETEPEEEVEKRPRVEVPEDYEDRANNDLWDWDANKEKVKEAEKLLRDTDRCCFCDFDCPPPSEQENKSRLFGVLESLLGHIELSHPLAYEWLG